MQVLCSNIFTGIICILYWNMGACYLKCNLKTVYFVKTHYWEPTVLITNSKIDIRSIKKNCFDCSFKKDIHVIFWETNPILIYFLNKTSAIFHLWQDAWIVKIENILCYIPFVLKLLHYDQNTSTSVTNLSCSAVLIYLLIQLRSWEYSVQVLPDFF